MEINRKWLLLTINMNSCPYIKYLPHAKLYTWFSRSSQFCEVDNLFHPHFTDEEIVPDRG